MKKIEAMEYRIGSFFGLSNCDDKLTKTIVT